MADVVPSAANLTPDVWRRLTLAGDYRQIFATAAGKNVLRDIFRFCGAGQDPFQPGDPHQSSYNLGRNRVMLRIASQLRMDPVEIIKSARSADDGNERHGQDTGAIAGD